MTTLSDNNTEHSLDISKDMTKITLKILYRMIIEISEQRAKNNLEKIEKKDPQRIKTADIQSDNIEKFKFLASENNIKAYEIDDSYKIPTLKYDIKDEHKIVNVYKEIEEGFTIPENRLQAFISNNINKDKVIEIINNKFKNTDKNKIENEINNSENYKENEIINNEKNNIGKEKSDRPTIEEIDKNIDKEYQKYLNHENKNNKDKSKEKYNIEKER